MKKFSQLSWLFAIASAFQIPAHASIPMHTFQLNVRGDAVMPLEQRAQVMAVGEAILQRDDSAFVSLLHNLPNPFLYDSRAESLVETLTETEPEAEPAPTPTLSEAMVLEQIAPIIAARISGTLERGANHFVQLSGGELLQVGNRLPVRIPSLSDQTFMIDVIAIDPTRMVLGLGESRTTLSLTSTASGGAQLMTPGETRP